jgi:hypothetical protein
MINLVFYVVVILHGMMILEQVTDMKRKIKKIIFKIILFF